MTAIFIVLGLFTIAAGLLLIFLILVMLAAERRPEMGMSRAVGMKRRQLIESFMAEGMAYSLTSALVGAALGVLDLARHDAGDAIHLQRADVDIAFHVTAAEPRHRLRLGVVAHVRHGRDLRPGASAASASSPPSAMSTSRRRARPGALSGALGGVADRRRRARHWRLGLSRRTRRTWFGAGALACRSSARPSSRARSASPSGPCSRAASLAVARRSGCSSPAAICSALTGHAGCRALETFFVGGVLMVAAATFVVDLQRRRAARRASRRRPRVLARRARRANRRRLSAREQAPHRHDDRHAVARRVRARHDLDDEPELPQALPRPPTRAAAGISRSPRIPTNRFPADERQSARPARRSARSRASTTRARSNRSPRCCVANPRTHADRAGRRRRPAGQSQRLPGPRRRRRLPRREHDRAAGARRRATRPIARSGTPSRADPSNAVIDGSVVPGINYANVTRVALHAGRTTKAARRASSRSRCASPTARPARCSTCPIIGIMKRGPSETYRGLWMSAGGARPTTFHRCISALLRAAAARRGRRSRSRGDGGGARPARRHGRFHRSSSARTSRPSATPSSTWCRDSWRLASASASPRSTVIAFRTVVERRQQIGLMRAIGFTPRQHRALASSSSRRSSRCSASSTASGSRCCSRTACSERRVQHRRLHDVLRPMAADRPDGGRSSSSRPS